MTTGHLFVVNSRVEHLGWDAAVVPTDGDFDVVPYWAPVLGTRDFGSLRPHGWGRGSAAPSRGGRGVWFLDVAMTDIDALAAQLRLVLDRIAAQGIVPKDGRALPLVVMPVLGSGAGGFNHVRGELLVALLDAGKERAETLGIDVAIVAANASAYAALQSLRSVDRATGLDAKQLRHAKALGAKAASGDLALFLGAGVSMAAGLPSWSRLLRLLTPADLDVDGLGALDHAELLRRHFDEREAGPGPVPQRRRLLGAEVVKRIAGARRPSLAHALLAGLRCREIVTTNYDDLFERAVAAVVDPQAARARPAFSTVISVLPWVRPRPDLPWILKMHGDVRRPESIVLSRRDFVLYDSTWRPVGSVVQSLMLSRHLLVVGASLTDDNLLRLAHEVMAFRTANVDKPEPIGTVLTLEPKRAAEQLWKNELVHIPVRNRAISAEPDSARESDTRAAVRALTVFLDAVAVFAATDASYLADDRYEGMLSPEEKDAAETARALFVAAQGLATGQRGSHWQALADSLQAFGARKPDRREARYVQTKSQR